MSLPANHIFQYVAPIQIVFVLCKTWLQSNDNASEWGNNCSQYDIFSLQDKEFSNTEYKDVRAEDWMNLNTYKNRPD